MSPERITVTEQDERTMTDYLVRSLLGWKLAPDRYIKGDRSWIPRWRFSPFENVEDAFTLLEAVASGYMLTRHGNGKFTATVSICGCSASASGEAKARTITEALCRCLQRPHKQSKLSAPPSRGVQEAI